MKKMFLCLCSCIVSSLILLNCDSPAEPEDNMPDSGYVQVVYPKGGESFTVSDTVTIQFKINAYKVGSAMPTISINGGMSYDDIPKQAVYANSGGGGQLLTCQWIIGQEVNPVTYDSTLTNCKIKVSDYTTPSESDVSGAFTVSP